MAQSQCIPIEEEGNGLQDIFVHFASAYETEYEERRAKETGLVFLPMNQA